MPIILDKHLGETPLQALDRLLLTQPELAAVSLTYAGRLDPMAEGVLIALVGDECNQIEKEKYLALDKEYEVEILFGLETDSHDVLGLITGASKKQPPRDVVESEIKKLVGKHEQPYPGYSSKPVQGKPLFQWAREGKLNEIEVPSRKIEIFRAAITDVQQITSAQILKQVTDSINLVTGDFRQAETLQKWQQTLIGDNLFVVYRLTITCSSGTYIRQIAQQLGQKVGTGALVLNLKRTRVGPYFTKDAR